MITLEKVCKQCGASFIVKAEKCGQGSTSKLRQSYCSLKCKTLHSKRPDVGNKVELTCEECGKVYHKPPSQAKYSKTCSRRCHHIRLSRLATIKRKSIEFVIRCEICGVEFTTCRATRKYCSHDCSSKSHLTEKGEFTCQQCGKVSLVKCSYAKRAKYCSRNCVNIAQSKSPTYVFGRTGYRTDIENDLYFKSSFEADYYRYALYVGKRLLYEPTTFDVIVDGKERHYTPDYFLQDENCYLELKGLPQGDSAHSMMINTNTNARLALNSQGIVKVDVLYMKDFYDTLKESGLYDKIPNLERRDYDGTKHLIRKHNKDTKN